jgi:hypothetical protein
LAEHVIGAAAYEEFPHEIMIYNVT